MEYGEAADGLDVGRDYCASGVAVQYSTGASIYSSGPLAFVSNATYAPSAPTPTTFSLPFDRTATQPTAAIVGGVIGAITFLLLLLSIFLHVREEWRVTDRRLKASGEDTAGWTSEKLSFLPQSTCNQSDNAIPQVPSTSLPSELHNGEKNPSLSLTLHSKRGWISRILVFLALEMAYLGLLAIACLQPIVLPRLSVAHLTEAKGVTTIFAIAWQTLAILPVTDILSTIFSSEWSHSFWRTGELTPGKTDRVSIPTAGLLDRSKHFCAPNASLAFRLAFPALLLAQALVRIAPGALTVNTIFVPSAVLTQVRNIDLNTVDSYGASATSHPSLLVRMEQVEHGQYGFRPSEPGVFVGCPQLSSLTATTGNLTYLSDIARFNYECRWVAPMLVNTRNHPFVNTFQWAVDGKTNEEELWEIYSLTASDIRGSSSAGIFALTQLSGELSESCASSRGISAWLFLGSNSSYPALLWSYSLDLGNVPASHNEIFHWIAASDWSRDSGAPLRVTLPSHVGNISPASAGLMLAQSLLGYTAVDCYRDGFETTTLAACNMSASIFLQEPVPFYTDLRPPDPVAVRSASNISSTIGSYVASASKAWSDGRYTSDKFSGTSVDAIKEMPKLAFVASGPLTIAVGILAFTVLELVAAELWIQVGEPFSIASLTAAFNSDGF